MQLCVCARARVCMCVYVCVYVCMCVYACVYVCMCVWSEEEKEEGRGIEIVRWRQTDHRKRLGAEFGEGKTFRGPNFRMTFLHKISIFTSKIIYDDLF